MSANLFFDLRARPLDANGDIMPGCYYQFYQSLTTTPTPVYADDALTTPLANPLITAAEGRFPVIYMDSSVVYRVQLFDANDVLQYDADPVHPLSSVPTGTVVMFHGDAAARDAAYPPALFELCDGDLGTPDTRDRSPVGVSATKPISGAGSTGGSAGGNTGNAGAHTHSGGSVGATALSVAQLPAVTLEVRGSYAQGGYDGGGNEFFRARPSNPFGTSHDLINTFGGGQTHTHTAGDTGSAGDHAHTIATLTPYFTIFFLKRK